MSYAPKAAECIRAHGPGRTTADITRRIVHMLISLAVHARAKSAAIARHLELTEVRRVCFDLRLCRSQQLQGCSSTNQGI